MNWYHQHRNQIFPEIDNLPSSAQRDLFHKSKTVTNIRMIRLLTVVLISVAGTAVLLVLTMHIARPVMALLCVLPAMFIAFFPSLLPIIWSFCARRLQRRWIEHELLKLGLRPALCFSCAYNLCGTPDDSTACPECGTIIAAVTAELSEDNPCNRN